MKKIILTSILLATAAMASAQGESHKTKLVLSAGLTQDTTITGKQDTVKLKFGTTIVWVFDEQENAKDKEPKKEKDPKAKDFSWCGYGGVHYGFMNLVDANQKRVDAPWLDNTGKKNYSSTIAFSLFKKSFEIVPNRFRLSTGVGFKFNTIAMNTTYRLIDGDSLHFQTNASPSYRIATLNANYIQVPLVFQYNSKFAKDADGDDRTFYCSAGLVGSYLIGSNAFYKWDENGSRHKQRVQGNYGLNSYLVNGYVEMGILNGLAYYVELGLNPMFQANKGPEVYNMTFGLRLCL